MVDWGNICVPTVSFIPSSGFLGEISLNAAIVVMQFSAARLRPTAPPSHKDRNLTQLEVSAGAMWKGSLCLGWKQ